MNIDIDQETRVIQNKNSAELLEIKYKRKIVKRMDALERDIQALRKEIKGELSLVI
jgi:hypothetical protein